MFRGMPGGDVVATDINDFIERYSKFKEMGFEAEWEKICETYLINANPAEIAEDLKKLNEEWAKKDDNGLRIILVFMERLEQDHPVAYTRVQEECNAIVNTIYSREMESELNEEEQEHKTPRSLPIYESDSDVESEEKVSKRKRPLPVPKKFTFSDAHLDLSAQGKLARSRASEFFSRPAPEISDIYDLITDLRALIASIGKPAKKVSDEFEKRIMISKDLQERRGTPLNEERHVSAVKVNELKGRLENALDCLVTDSNTHEATMKFMQENVERLSSIFPDLSKSRSWIENTLHLPEMKNRR